MKRKPEATHIDYVCPGHYDDSISACQFCDGGLVACEVCGAFEGATTTHCPRRSVDKDTWDDVYRGALDYRFGTWIDRPSRHSPAWWRKHGERVHSLVVNFNGHMDDFGRGEQVD